MAPAAHLFLGEKNVRFEHKGLKDFYTEGKA